MAHEEVKEIVAGCVLVAISTIAVALRIYTKVVKRIGKKIDDWLSVVSLTLLYGMLVQLLLWATIGGSGKHTQDVPPEQLTVFFKLFYTNELTYITASACIKLTILAFYRGIFSVRKFRLVINAVGAFVILVFVGFFFAATFQCTPVSAYWDFTLPHNCFDPIKYILVFQGFNILQDTMILLLPLPMIWGLQQRSWQDKAGLTGVFSLGAFVIAASIYRVITLLRIRVDDITFTTTEAVIWTFVEPCIGLVCACLPIIRGLFPAFKAQGSKGGHGEVSMKLKGYRTPGGTGAHSYRRMQGGSFDTGGRESSALKHESRPAHGGIHVTTTISVA